MLKCCFFAAEMTKTKAGFIALIGKPNAGKSTLLNAILGRKLAITTPKAQTTRHRILGMAIHNNCQLVFSDTPGIIEPKYKLQEYMMDSVSGSLQDADALVVLVEVNDLELPAELQKEVEKRDTPIVVVINKIDTSSQDKIEEKVAHWEKKLKTKAVLAVSALHSFNIDSLKDLLVELCPEHPFYYPEDQITDKSERFFVGEIIREKILILYRNEIPYSTEVDIEEFKDEGHIIRITAMIYVERNSQKRILIGKGGLALKKTGTDARKDIEIFLGRKVFLSTFIKVRENWRRNETQLKKFGYNDQ
jgi:GTPase